MMKRFLCLLLTMLFALPLFALAEQAEPAPVVPAEAELLEAGEPELFDAEVSNPPEIVEEADKAELVEKDKAWLKLYTFNGEFKPCGSFAVGEPVIVSFDGYGVDVKDLRWSSSSTKVLAFQDLPLDEYFIVFSAKAKGTSTVKVWSARDSRISASVKVTVTAAPKLSKVCFSIGGTDLTVYPTIYTNDPSFLGTPQGSLEAALRFEPTSITADQVSLTWKSSKPKIVSVDAKTGVITFLKYGTAKLTVTAKYGGVKKSASITIGSKPEDTIDQLMFIMGMGTIKSARIPVGAQNTNLWEDLYWRPEVDKSELTFAWKSSNTRVASVDPESGVLWLKKPGTAKITVTAKQGKVKRTASISLTVYDPSVPDKVFFSCGTKHKLDLVNDAVFDFNDQLEFDVDDYSPNLYDITWKSSNPKVASVDPDTGILTLHKKGTTKVTATVLCFSTKRTATCTVTVGSLDYDLTSFIGGRLTDMKRTYCGTYKQDTSEDWIYSHYDVWIGAGHLQIEAAAPFGSIMRIRFDTANCGAKLCGIGASTSRAEAVSLLKKKGWTPLEKKEPSYEPTDYQIRYLKKLDVSTFLLTVCFNGNGDAVELLCEPYHPGEY